MKNKNQDFRRILEFFRDDRMKSAEKVKFSSVFLKISYQDSLLEFKTSERLNFNKKKISFVPKIPVKTIKHKNLPDSEADTEEWTESLPSFSSFSLIFL